MYIKHLLRDFKRYSSVECWRLDNVTCFNRYLKSIRFSSSFLAFEGLLAKAGAVGLTDTMDHKILVKRSKHIIAISDSALQRLHFPPYQASLYDLVMRCSGFPKALLAVFLSLCPLPDTFGSFL